MTIPTDLRLRPGPDRSYLNIDVAGVEIGHLLLAADGRVVDSWAKSFKNRDLVSLVSRCYAAAHATVSSRAPR